MGLSKGCTKCQGSKVYLIVSSKFYESVPIHHGKRAVDYGVWEVHQCWGVLIFCGGGAGGGACLRGRKFGGGLRDDIKRFGKFSIVHQ